MIRVNYVMRRRRDVPAETFAERLRESFGPTVAKHQGVLDLRRCVLSYSLRIDPLGEALRAARPGMQAPFDGVASFWWPDRDRMVRAMGTREGSAAFEELLECERTFVDLAGSALFAGKEVPQINPMPEDGVLARVGTPIVKLIYVLRALPALGRDGCQSWWQTRHGAITRRYGTAMGFLRYIQSHTVDDPLNERLRGPRGAQAPYDGLTEVWFDRLRLAELVKEPDSDGAEGFGLLLEDEPKFVDLSRSTTWFAKEQVLVER